MLEFFIFLSSNDKEILKLVEKAGFTIEENTSLCLLGDKFFGFLKKRQRKVVICTSNAMKIGGYELMKHNLDDENHNLTPLYIRRALRHEATHVAQLCNQGKVLDPSFALENKIHPFKANAIKNSVRISGNIAKENEAYWMEDRPKDVLSALERYCL